MTYDKLICGKEPVILTKDEWLSLAEDIRITLDMLVLHMIDNKASDIDIEKTNINFITAITAMNYVAEYATDRLKFIPMGIEEVEND